MKKTITELAAELLVKNQNARHNSTIEVKDEYENQFTFLFYSTGYNEYTQHIFNCYSNLYERPIGFAITTIAEHIDMDDSRNIEYHNEIVSKHEKTLRRAIELALSHEAKPAR
jgi:hypothetical protein